MLFRLILVCLFLAETHIKRWFLSRNMPFLNISIFLSNSQKKVLIVTKWEWKVWLDVCFILTLVKHSFLNVIRINSTSSHHSKNFITMFYSVFCFVLFFTKHTVSTMQYTYFWVGNIANKIAELYTETLITWSVSCLQAASAQ